MRMMKMKENLWIRFRLGIVWEGWGFLLEFGVFC